MQDLAENIDKELAQVLSQELEKILSELKQELTDKQKSQILSYLLLMLEQNKTLNLSGITEPAEVIRLHVLDSWTILPFLKAELARKAEGQTLRFIDVGTGAGFPGIPVKIALPEIELYLMDALRKRLKFIDRASSEAGIECVHTLHLRAEDAGKEPKYREAFDFVTARALANLSVLLEYCLPLVKVGGVFCAMKAKAEDELHEAKKVPAKLGAELEEVKEFILPGAEAQRTIIIYRKLKPCPKKYPRSNAKIKKQPLS